MASYRDAVNLGSYLALVALALACSLFFGSRLLHVTPWRSGQVPGDGVFAPAQAAAHLPGHHASTAPAPGDIPVETGARATVPAPAPPPAPGLPEVVNHGDRSRPMVALTFDSNMTPAMLRELDRGTVKRFVNDAVIAELRHDQVPATFFLSGLWIERYRDVATNLGNDPLFEVASHSYSHEGFRRGCYGLATLDLGHAVDDIRRNADLLASISPHPTRYFRFPGGCMDAAALAAVRPARVQVIQFDVVAGDPFSNDPKQVIANTVNGAHNGSIVVLHVTGGNTAPITDRALPAIVKQLRARGFQLVRLSDLLQGGNAA